MRVGDIKDHPDNWHIHPLFQSRATAGGITQLGIADVLLAYQSEKYGGLTLINGHDRKSLNPDLQWHIAILDISDEEADLLLSMHDTTAKWGQIDPIKLDAILKRTKASNSMTLDATQRLKEQIASQVDIAKRAAGDEDAPPKPASPYAELGKQKSRSVKVVVPVDNLADIEKALKATGKRRRGAALEELARFYLENSVED